MERLDFENSYGARSFSSMLYDETMTNIKKYFSVYTVNFEMIKFSVVTVFPSVANNFVTFLLPFYLTTWILLVSSSIMVATLVPSSVSSSGFWIYDRLEKILF